jgi:hypothetical protein
MPIADDFLLMTQFFNTFHWPRELSELRKEINIQFGRF